MDFNIKHVRKKYNIWSVALFLATAQYRFSNNIWKARTDLGMIKPINRKFSMFSVTEMIVLKEHFQPVWNRTFTKATRSWKTTHSSNFYTFTRREKRIT